MEIRADILFWVFSAMVCLPIIYLLFTTNVIRAAFAFTISLLGVAAIYVLLNADFMAVVQLLIYAGGIVVLLIFGVMLTKRSKEPGVISGEQNKFIAILVSVGLLGVVTWLVKGAKLMVDAPAQSNEQTNKIGILYLTDHLVSFELIAYLLLAALVGAAFLAKKSQV